MLNHNEVINLFISREMALSDKDVQKDAESWDLSGFRASPGKIATIYSFMKTKYIRGQTMEDMERITGIRMDSISAALILLEAHGYLTISRTNKPYGYVVIK